MSVPTIVNQNGAGPVLELPLNEQEQSHLQQSAQTLKKVIQTLDIPQR